MSTKALFITDPLNTLDYPRDTSVALMKEFHNQGAEVFHLDFFDIQDDLNLKVRLLLGQSSNKLAPFTWSAPQLCEAKSFHFIFHRKDPPVDQLYRDNCLKFSSLPTTVVQINDPKLIATLPEKLIPLEFENYCIPTQKISSEKDFHQVIKASPDEIVVKPINLYSGYGIEFFSKKTSDEALSSYYSKYGPDIIVQEYVPEAESIGDLRVLMFNGEILGSFMRRAAPGKRLQNLHQGGSIQVWPPNSNQHKAALEVGRSLAARGLFFLGVDFLGDRISEINITSPMGTVQIDELYNTYCETRVYKSCLKILSDKGVHI